MFLFIVYAVLMWWGAFHWRRHVLGFLSVLAGVALLVLLGVLHTMLGRMTSGQIFMPVFQGLLYPYAVLVFAIGLCFACAPTHTGGRLAAHGTHCRGCGYDLRGLDAQVRTCPECGLGRMAARGLRRCLHCNTDISDQPVSTRSCPSCGKHPRMRSRTDDTNALPAQPAAPVPDQAVMTFRPLRATPRAEEPVATGSQPPPGA